MSVDSPLVPALAALVRALESVGHPFMIIGGLAVIARGFPRLTLDVDAVVAGEGLDLDVAMARLARERIVPRIVDPIRFARERQILLVRHEPTGTQVDLSLAWLMFEQEALARASIEQFAGVVAPFPMPEDLIVYKAVAWRERDRTDIERLLLKHWVRVDVSRVRTLLAQFAELLDEPERVVEFDALVARVQASRHR